MLKIPEAFKSSRGDGRLSRTLKGLISALIFMAAMNTPLTEVEWIEIANQVLLATSALYGLAGLVAKLYNRFGDNS